MIGIIRDMLRAPDAQSDPHHWAATLLAHGWLGLAAALILPWWAVLLAYAAWEAAQWLYYGAEPWDCLLDWCAVALGVCVAVAAAHGLDGIGAALGVLLVAGIGMAVRR